MKFFSLYFVLIFILGCSQNNNQSISTEQNSEINSKNIVEEISKQVKHYDKEPRYYIKVSNQNCFSEILVNDIPVFQNFNDSHFSTMVEIGDLILKSGEQKITYRIYNLGNWEGKAYPTLNHNSELEIRVDRQDNKNLDDVEIITKSTSENIIGKTFHEKTFAFNANVPYVLENFEDAQDLRTIDQKELEKKVLEAYNKSKKVFEQHNKDKLAKLVYKRTKNDMISKYANKSYVLNAWTEILESLGNETFEVQPIENYKMVFYGNGKLVALVSNSNNSDLRGKSALWGLYKDEDGDLSGIDFKNYLYLPKGKTEFEIY